MKILITPLLSIALLASCSAEPGNGETAATEATTAPMAGADARSMGMTEADHQAMDMAPGNAAAAGTAATASGTVESIEPDANRIVIAHGPVEALRWPAMKMGFIATPEQLSALQVGQKVEFEFLSQGPNNTITRVTPIE